MNYKNNSLSCLGLILTLILSILSGKAIFEWIEPKGIIGGIIFIISWGFIIKVVQIAIYGLLSLLS